MPFLITPKFKIGSPGEWFEGEAYTTENIYSIQTDKMPPVHYDTHILKPHSLTHIETPKHTKKNGNDISFYTENQPKHFFGRCTVLKFKNSGWKQVNESISHKEISALELEQKLQSICHNKPPEKVLISIENIKENNFGFHEPNQVLTLSLEAAKYLTSLPNFNLFGTTWKSSDFQPGKHERPIHNELFKRALILENINLNHVPEGEYFITAFPLPLEAAAEAPVNAVLFSYEELSI